MSAADGVDLLPAAYALVTAVAHGDEAGFAAIASSTSKDESWVALAHLVVVLNEALAVERGVDPAEMWLHVGRSLALGVMP